MIPMITETVDPSAAEKIAKNILHLYLHNGRIVELLDFIIQYEVESTGLILFESLSNHLSPSLKN